MDYAGIKKELESQIKNAKLMAVSKLHTKEEVMTAYDAGFRLFGENHVQEIVEKFTEKPSDLSVHMIGHLQTNKVNKVVGLVDMIESVDSLHLLEKINSACEKIGRTMPVLLEINTSREEAKSGFLTVEEVYETVEESLKMKNVKIEGLMTVGPVDCSVEEKDAKTRQAFIELRSLRDTLKKKYPQLDWKELSMGMSGDYKIGVEEGSTIVRIGTMIFGKRNYA